MKRNIKFIQSYIVSVLYPEELYPRLHYPGLDNLLFSYFLTEINKSAKNKRIFEDGNPKKLEKLAKLILPFSRILKENPHYTVLIYSGVIERFVRQNLWKKDHWEDVTQEVTTRLLATKIFKIRKHYQKKFKKNPDFLSFFAACMRNTYIEVVRNKYSNILPLQFEQLRDEDLAKEENKLKDFALDAECRRLEKIFSLYHRSRHKLELCLKLKYRIQPKEEELSEQFPMLDKKDISILVQDFRFEKNKVVFADAAKALVIFNGGSQSPDSLRRWTNRKENEIIKKLNIFHKKEVYSLKTLEELTWVYYTQYSLINKKVQKLKQES